MSKFLTSVSVDGDEIEIGGRACKSRERLPIKDVLVYWTKHPDGDVAIHCVNRAGTRDLGGTTLGHSGLWIINGPEGGLLKSKRVTPSTARIEMLNVLRMLGLPEELLARSFSRTSSELNHIDILNEKGGGARKRIRSIQIGPNATPEQLASRLSYCVFGWELSLSTLKTISSDKSNAGRWLNETFIIKPLFKDPFHLRNDWYPLTSIRVSTQNPLPGRWERCDMSVIRFGEEGPYVDREEGDNIPGTAVLWFVKRYGLETLFEEAQTTAQQEYNLALALSPQDAVAFVLKHWWVVRFLREDGKPCFRFYPKYAEEDASPKASLIADMSSESVLVFDTPYPDRLKTIRQLHDKHGPAFLRVLAASVPMGNTFRRVPCREQLESIFVEGDTVYGTSSSLTTTVLGARNEFASLTLRTIREHATCIASSCTSMRTIEPARVLGVLVDGCEAHTIRPSLSPHDRFEDIWVRVASKLNPDSVFPERNNTAEVRLVCEGEKPGECSIQALKLSLDADGNVEFEKVGVGRDLPPYIVVGDSMRVEGNDCPMFKVIQLVA